MSEKNKTWEWFEEHARQVFGKDLLIPLLTSLAGAVLGLPFYAWVLLGAAGFFAPLVWRRTGFSAPSLAGIWKSDPSGKMLELARIEQDNGPIAELAEKAQKWRELEKHTGIHDFAIQMSKSKYAPQELVKRHDVQNLVFLGNGCSKWTSLLEENNGFEIKDFFYQIQRNQGTIKFLAACPQWMNEHGRQEKAKRIASSLLNLRRIMADSKHENGDFQLRLYSEAPSWRLTVVNDHECIVGHYGGGDSAKTPLLVIHQSENAWGFQRAYLHVFKMKWDRSRVPVEADWLMIKALSEGRVS